MGKKKEGYLYRMTVSLDDHKGPKNAREAAKFDRNLSHAILNLTKRKVKGKYEREEGLPKEWA